MAASRHSRKGFAARGAESSAAWQRGEEEDSPVSLGTFAKSVSVQGTQLLWQKFAVLPDQFAVEINFSAAVFWTLNVHHVPVDLASVPIVGFLVRLSRSKMKRAGNFLVEQYVAHRLQDVGIKSEREFADITGARI